MSVELALKMCPLFQGVSDKDLELLVPVCREEMAITGALVLDQGEQAQCLYLVVEGRIGLHMTLERPDGSSTGRTTVASIGPQEAFGWHALVPPFRSTFAATAVEFSRLYALEGSALREILEQHRDMGYQVMVNVASLVAERLVETREAFVYDRSYVEYLQRLPKDLG